MAIKLKARDGGGSSPSDKTDGPSEKPAVGSLHLAQSRSRPSSIYDLPPFERAVCCIKYYEGLHRKKDYPYVGYGHKLRPGER